MGETAQHVIVAPHGLARKFEPLHFAHQCRQDRLTFETRHLLTDAAVKMGATLVKAPFTTYYGWYQSVLLDPEGNAFRINFGTE